MSIQYFGTMVDRRSPNRGVFPVTVELEPLDNPSDKNKPVQYYSHTTTLVKFTNDFTGNVIVDIKVTTPSDYTLTLDNLPRYLRFQGIHGKNVTKEDYSVRYTLGGYILDIKKHDIAVSIAAISGSDDEIYPQVKYINTFTMLHEDLGRKGMKYQVGFDKYGLFITACYLFSGMSELTQVARYDIPFKKPLTVEDLVRLALNAMAWPYNNVNSTYVETFMFPSDNPNVLIWKNVDTFTYLKSNDGKLCFTLEKSLGDITYAAHRSLSFLGSDSEKVRLSEIISEYSCSPQDLTKACIDFYEDIRKF